MKLLMTNRVWLLVLVATAVVGLYLLVASGMGGLGFPLDDAWIHQTYARNLARNGRWEFVPGVVSAGSTAPLWTMLLALGWLLRLPYLAWAYALGWASLLGVGWVSGRLWRRLWPEATLPSWLVSVVVLLTWPLVWAAVSGMETLLFAGLALLVLVGLLGLLQDGTERPLAAAGLGVFSGLLVLTRPDGVVLILLALLALLLYRRGAQAGVYVLATALVLLPYFALNWWTSGTIWPNTFYAKQTEYVLLLQTPLLLRLWRLLYFTLGGVEQGWRGISAAHWLLLPGVIVAAWQALKADWVAKRPYFLLPLLWTGGHVLLYAWRLPLTFQHGRYLMATLPVWIVYGLAGWRQLWVAWRLPQRLRWVLGQVGRLTFAVLTLFFMGAGARAYALDVAFIENEMVAVAHWLAENTTPEAQIATHDIGAIGFFAERPLIDLAGLITPEVIPFLADEAEMAAYILQSSANYLVSAPGWPYTEVLAESPISAVYTTDYGWTRQNGVQNMTIYLLKTP